MEIIVHSVIIFAISAAIIVRLIDYTKKSQEVHRLFTRTKKTYLKKP